MAHPAVMKSSILRCSHPAGPESHAGWDVMRRHRQHHRHRIRAAGHGQLLRRLRAAHGVSIVNVDSIMAQAACALPAASRYVILPRARFD